MSSSKNTAEKATATSVENEKLLLAILRQCVIPTLDYEQLAADIGAPSKAAAGMRWSRYKRKIEEDTGKPISSATTSSSKLATASPSKPTGVTKKPGTPRKPKAQVATAKQGALIDAAQKNGKEGEGKGKAKKSKNDEAIVDEGEGDD